MDKGNESLEWPNALRAEAQWKGHGEYKFSCYIRLVLDKGKHVLHTMSHCCVWQRTLPNLVDFDLIKGWLNKCDEEHEHGPATLFSKRELHGRRLIDVRNRCITSTTNTRYAALNYT